MDPLIEMAAQMKDAIANPRQPAGEGAEAVVLYDYKGRATPPRPQIVAKEILKTQGGLPETLLYAEPPAPSSGPVAGGNPLGAFDPPAEQDDHACSECDKSFTTASGLKRHKTTKHKD